MKRIQSKILQNYSTPWEKTLMYNENLKRQREEDKPFREIILKQVGYENPRASQSRIQALTFKKMNESSMQKVLLIQTINHQQLKQLNNNEVKSSYKKIRKFHNGIYSKNPATGKEEWSCCIQSSKNAIVL